MKTTIAVFVVVALLSLVGVTALTVNQGTAPVRLAGDIWPGANG